MVNWKRWKALKKTDIKRCLIKYVGWGLLYCGKPFSAIGNWFWKKHKKVLDLND